MGGPGLVSIDQTGCSLVEAVNAGPETIQLHRGQQIGIADNVDGEDLVYYNADVVNAIVERKFKNRAKTELGSSTSEFQKMCKLEVPAEYQERYQKLLLKHRKVFSLDKSDLGYGSTVLHQLFMKLEEPRLTRLTSRIR